MPQVPVNRIASDEQLIAALKAAGGNKMQAAKALGIDPRAFRHRLPSLTRRGWAPDYDQKHPVPDGQKLRGVSTYYDAEGKPTQQWVKSSLDEARQAELLRLALEAMVADLPKLPRTKPDTGHDAQLMACYPIGDAHIGMRSWGEETGQDWDLAIAERVHCAAVAELVRAAPKARHALIVDLGDFLHWDGMAAVTARSGHLLDADGRYAKMVGVGIKIVRQAIASALTKHETVRFIAAPGNHNESSALFMALALAAIYENEPRVTVDTSPALFQYIEFGKVLIGVHHGHTCKPDRLAGVMAADRPEAWGRTRFRYWWMGHIHTQTVKEYPGVTVESFNTLAPNDAYAASAGYRSRENMKCLVLHAEHGEVGRHTVHPAMLEAA